MLEIDSYQRTPGNGLSAKTLEETLPAPAAPSTVPNEETQRLAAAAVKFEAFFVAQMLQQMRQATAALAPEGGALRQQANQAPLALADQAVADALAGTRAFGIADILVRQMGVQGAGAQEE